MKHCRYDTTYQCTAVLYCGYDTTYQVLVNCPTVYEGTRGYCDTHLVRLAVPQLAQVGLRRPDEARQVVFPPPGEQVLVAHRTRARLPDAPEAGHVHVAAGASHARHEQRVLAGLADAL